MLMKISQCLLPVLLLIAFTSRGQGFIKNYPPATSEFQDVVTTTDGGYFLAGNTPTDSSLFLQRVGPTGTVVWANHLPLNGARTIAACSAPDGGFVVLADYYATSQGFRNIVLKLSSSGVLLWQTQVNNTFLVNGLRDIIRTSDGQFLAAGDTRNNQLQQNIWLVKLNADGDQLWSKSVGDSLYNEQVSRLLELPNGNIVVSGAGVHGNDRDLFLVKTDPEGDLIWEKWYAQPFTQNSHDLARLNDGGLAVLASTYGDNPSKIALLRTDGDGVLDFFRENSAGLTLNPNPPFNVIRSFATDFADNFYVPVGTQDVFSLWKTATLLKFDAFGDSVWTKSLVVDGLPQQIIRSSVGQFVIIGEGDGSAGAFLVKTDALGEIYSNQITGSLYHDQNDNCSKDSGEPPMDNFVIRAENQQGEIFFTNPAADGSFQLIVAEGAFTVAVGPLYGTENLWLPCDSQTVTISGSNQTVAILPLGLRSVADCPLLDVEIGAGFLRRCTTSAFNVHYCNNGTLAAANASIQVTADPKMAYQSSTVALTSQNGNVLTFNVPDVLPGDCKSFEITFLVSCAAILGEVLCTEAHIFPDSACLPPNAGWDGSHLEVSGACNGEVEFTIRNTGSSMTGTADYVIIEDQIMYMQGQVQLAAGEDTLITVPNPGGLAYYLQTEQLTGHPGHNQPSAAVQQCGTASTSNLALQLPQNETDPFVALHCDQVVGSFDPNDKRGFPLGWQAAHFIEPGQELEYMIRFQNTGTDTAFQVVLRDTITPQLDMTSLRAGASSHPYTYTVSGAGELTFEFPNILLPDSNVNEAASHGYVQFRLRQRPGLAQGEVIENRAAIYFDFNAPVLTNTSLHTIGYPLLSATVDRPTDHALNLRVFPNPLADQVTFQVDGLPADSHFLLSLFNVHGALTRQEQFDGTGFRLQRNALLPGIYFFQLTEKRGRTARGKIIVR